jgi:hypothetical protein
VLNLTTLGIQHRKWGIQANGNRVNGRSLVAGFE